MSTIPDAKYMYIHANAIFYMNLYLKRLGSKFSNSRREIQFKWTNSMNSIVRSLGRISKVRQLKMSPSSTRSNFGLCYGIKYSCAKCRFER